MKILVCGGRHYNNLSAVRHALFAVHKKRGISLVIEGGATGADRLAREWAIANKIPVQTFEITDKEWKEVGPSAGPKRNSRMLAEGKPDGVIAFPGNSGTADMIRKSEAAGVKVWRIA